MVRLVRCVRCSLELRRVADAGQLLASLCLGLLAWLSFAPTLVLAKQPNVVLILADDLGYGDLGCYGQRQIRTPVLDALAAQGLRCTTAYSGSTVCAPSRCALMTGLHTGHTRIRDNALIPLEPADVTLAEILRQAGYATAMFGKWGLGEADSTGVPTRQGFDAWFGYLNQRHAHNYYPDFLWEGETRYVVQGNLVRDGVAYERAQYSPDLFVARALEFLRQPRDGRPFFLYLPLIIPHANNEAGNLGMEVPSDEAYQNEDWPQVQKSYAALVTRLDTYVGQVLAELRSQGLERDTVVIFTSDNGPDVAAGFDPQFFESTGDLRGYKRDLYEGGIRVPLIVSWPGHISSHTFTDPVAAWDLLPTLAELAGQAPPSSLDGISFAGAWLENDPRRELREKRPPLYWEFHQRGFQQAVRVGNWKAIRLPRAERLELYDLANDPKEVVDVADQFPQVVEQLRPLFTSLRVPSPHWKTPAEDGNQ